MFRRARSRWGQIRTREKVLYVLKEQGPSDSQGIAFRLGISAMAIRQHLYALRRKKLVAFKSEGRPYGRPANVWHLTDAADLLFPDSHASLAGSLIRAIRALMGKRGLERILASWSRQELAEIRKHLPKLRSLRATVERLASIRDEQGYMAEAKQGNGESFLLVEHHCPIRAAVREFSGFCMEEMEILQKVLAPSANVERVEHILEGDRQCLYVIRPAK